jgi:PAP_fibrillin
VTFFKKGHIFIEANIAMVSQADLKAELMATLSPLNRGVLATAEQKLAITALITRLEDFNPTPRPLEAPELLNGNWQLLYTTSDELLGIDRFPLVRLGNVYQCIQVESQRIYNIAEIPNLPLLDGLVCVSAQFEPVSAQRVNVKFDRAIFGLQKLLGYEAPDPFMEKLKQTPKLNLLQGIDFTISPSRDPGWLEVTYLEADMRIGRGNQGSLFVLKKV